jgi:hypothetical protein
MLKKFLKCLNTKLESFLTQITDLERKLMITQQEKAVYEEKLTLNQSENGEMSLSEKLNLKTQITKLRKKLGEAQSQILYEKDLFVKHQTLN